MSRPFNSVKYSELRLRREISTDDGTTCVDGFVDEQFEEAPPVIPWKSLTYIGVLLSVGVACFTYAAVIAIISSKVDWIRFGGLSVLGTLTFIPGSRYSYIFVNAYFKLNNYTYNDIPSIN